MSTERPASEFFNTWTLKECRATKSKKVPAPHQQTALGNLGRWYAGLPRSDAGGILVLPTGGGKTFTAVRFLCDGPLSDGYKVLWLAHTHHLLEQAFASYADSLGQIREPRAQLALRVVSGTPGHFPPRDIKPTDDVVIATLQTITNAHREKLAQLTSFIESAKGKLFIVFDEAHHSPAPSYRKLLLALRELGAAVLGLTATPTYSDESKQGWLKKLFPQGIRAQARTADLIAQGILARPKFSRVRTEIVPDFDEPDYQKWRGTDRDIPDEIVAKLAGSARRNALIARTYADNREKFGKTLIFTDRWFQCVAIVEALEQAGVRAGAMFSHVDAPIATVQGRRARTRDDNAKELARFRKGEIDVLVNVRMLTEGTDLPDAQTVFLTRQTTSRILLTQMVGRALRGPKFGGTENANIVSFVDDWQQSIRWAEYDQLAEGPADDGERPSSKTPPLQLISIDLVKRLARQMAGGQHGAIPQFSSLMPTGWYFVNYDACLPGSDEVAFPERLVMVFEDERAGFERLIDALLESPPLAFESETIAFEDQREALEQWRGDFFSGVQRAPSDLLHDIFHVARHVGQGRGVPQFFEFEDRRNHDLDELAGRFIADDLGPRKIYEALSDEFARKDRYWRALFPRFEHFQRYAGLAQERIVAGAEAGPSVVPSGGEAPSFSEPDEAVKAQVKERDGQRCLACGSTRSLEVDHVAAVYVGGSNDSNNLQTLCKSCNGRKGRRSMRFGHQQPPPAVKPPTALEQFDAPRGENAANRDHWERFLRRTINFAYQCAAVSTVEIAGKGEGYHNWTVDLVRGNDLSWLGPHLKGLVARIQEARRDGGKPPIQSLTITSPGAEPLVWR